MPRFDDQPEYGRPRDAVRRNDGRDVRRALDPAERRPVMDRDYHMDDAMDIRMDTRPEPRAANTGTRVSGPVRGIDPRGERDVLYRDPRTGELFRDVSNRRTPYENEFEELTPNNRPIVVTAGDPGPKPLHAEYFLPGEGIEREVIQAEICRYLGQDATCKPGRDQDNRAGFLIKAYRAPTTEMIRSLRESSTKFRNEEKYWADKERRRRRPEVSYTPIQDHQYDRDMDMDDDDRSYMQSERYPREIDPRDPRAQIGGRPMPVTTSAYLPEPGYPAYSISSAQSGAPPHMGFEPRTFAAAGNTTPPTGFRPTGYPPADLPPRTVQPPSAPMPTQPYTDPRTGKIVNSYPNYPADARPRR